MRMQRFLDVNRDEIGAPLSTHRTGVNARALLHTAGPWAVMTGLFALLPLMSATDVVICSAIVAVVCVLLLVHIASESLVVCERGLVIGTPSPFWPLFIVRYEQITPGSLVPVTQAQRYAATTKPSGRSASVRASVGVVRGMHFVGPEVRDTTRPHSAAAPLTSAPPRAVDGRTIWFAGSGATPPSTLVAEIAQAARRLSLHALADAAGAASTRALTKNPAERHTLLPGYPPYAADRGR